MPASKTSGESAYAALIDAIRTGVYAPGNRLREEEVGERLGLSRTPVREALRRLENDGIVEHIPRSGAVIRTLGHAELVELYDMRTVLECTAAEMAAKHGSESEFDALEAINDQIQANREHPSTAAAINQDFHRRLYDTARNRFLIDAARALNNALLLVVPTTYTDADRVDIVVSQHNDIISALREGNAENARQAAAIHLRMSLTHRLKGLSG